MKKLSLLISILLVAFCIKAQVIDESFENGIPEGWTVIDNDGVKDTWLSSDASGVPHTGTYGLAVDTYDSEAPGPSDDWLITPQITVEEGMVASFWARSRSGSYPDAFKVWVSKGDATIENFTIMLLEEGTVPEPYTKYQYTLQENADINVGDQIYIAVQSVTEGSMLYLDDFRVGQPEIGLIMAYTVGDNELDVMFDAPVTDDFVNVADFQLTGTATITFSEASIDADDARIVHLSGASEPMVADFALDNFAHAGVGANYDFYAGVSPISYANLLNTDGTLTKMTATFKGIVLMKLDSRVWIRGAEGAYNGVDTYGSDFAIAVGEPGDEILFTGMVSPYGNQTEIVSPMLITTLSTGNDQYAASEIMGAEIDASLEPDTDPGEKWESTLVTIKNASVESVDAGTFTCTDDEGASYFLVGEHSKFMFFDGSLEESMEVGKKYDITGVVVGREGYRLTPRNIDDIVEATSTAINETNDINVKIYPNPATDYIKVEHFGRANRVVVTDIIGNVIYDANCNGSETQKINLTKASQGVYMVAIMNNNKLVKASKIIKK